MDKVIYSAKIYSPKAGLTAGGGAPILVYNTSRKSFHKFMKKVNKFLDTLQAIPGNHSTIYCLEFGYA